MKVPTNFNTSIDSLLIGKNEETIFLSSWDVADDNLLDIDFSKMITNNLIKQNTYFFMDEFDDYKKRFISNNQLNIRYDNMAIGANGTINASLSLHVLNQKMKLKVLVLTPIYYTYLKVLKDLNVEVYYYKVISEDSLEFCPNISNIEDIIKKNLINLVIINDPIFGTGVKVPVIFYQKLLSVCRPLNTYILIDYIYGGMEWEHLPELINKSLVDLINSYSNIIILDSLSKKLFLNGLKSGTIYGHQDIIKDIEKYSVYLSGSLSFPQMSIFEEIHHPKNHRLVRSKLENSLEIAKDNLELVQTFFLQSNFIVSPCNSGYYCLVGLPKRLYANSDNIAQEILTNFNVLTIPHERYLFSSSKYYCFRMNLLLPKNELISAIKKMLGANFDYFN